MKPTMGLKKTDLPSYYCVVHSLEGGSASIFFYKTIALDERAGEFTIGEDCLAKLGLNRKGAIFEVRQTPDRCLLPRPDLEDNKWSQQAKQIDTSYLDE
jgi:hypothetical protein